MGRSYASFLLRLWRLGPDKLRIKLEHIQSGKVAQVTTLAEVLAWLEGHAASTQERGQVKEEVIRPAE